MKAIVTTDLNLSELRTAVIYRRARFVPSSLSGIGLDQVIEDNKASLIQHKGTRQVFSNHDFGSTSFEYIVEKEKYNDKFKLNLLADESRKAIGHSVSDLEKIERFMFPTVGVSSEVPKSTYFGSGVLDPNTTVTLLNLVSPSINDQGYDRIEFYGEEGIMSNNQRGNFITTELLDLIGEEPTFRPILVLSFGPDHSVNNNITDLYWPGDPQLEIKNNSPALSNLDYRKLKEEVDKSKAVWVVISQGKLEKVNLAYHSWRMSENPHQYMHNHTLRNDEFWTRPDNIESSSGLWYDESSGTLLGNTSSDISEYPILFQKYNKHVLGNTSNNWLQDKTYTEGDIVTWGHVIWQALSEIRAYQPCPGLNPSWAVKSSIDNALTPQVSVSGKPKKGGFLNPSGLVTVLGKNYVQEFTITENLGYSLNHRYPVSYSDTENMPEDSYKLTVTETQSGSQLKTLSILDWTKPLESGKLFFNFDYVACLVRLLAIAKAETFYEKDIIVPSSDWAEFWEEPDFVPEVKIDSVISTPSQDGDYQGDPGQTVSVSIPKLKKWQIDYVKSGNNYYNLSHGPSGETMWSDKIEVTLRPYTLMIVPRVFTIRVTEWEGFEVSDLIAQVSYGKSWSLGFFGSGFREVEITGAELDTPLVLNPTTTVGTLGISKVSLVQEPGTDEWTLTIKNAETDYEIKLRK